jgi:glucose/arabinose dehydrogenase
MACAIVETALRTAVTYAAKRQSFGPPFLEHMGCDGVWLVSQNALDIFLQIRPGLSRIDRPSVVDGRTGSEDSCLSKEIAMRAGRAIFFIALCLAPSAVFGDESPRRGAAAYGDWQEDAPGVRRLITLADLPVPYATPSSANPSRVSLRPASAFPKAPAGFQVDLFANGLSAPRVIRVAPNGDIFVAESGAGRVRVFRGQETSPTLIESEIFAEGLPRVFGIAFYPSGLDPHWVYVATESSVSRFPYRSGDLKASGAPQLIVPNLPTGGSHWTRDLAFSPDDKTMFVSVGSASNDASGPASIASHLLRGLWDREQDRADVLAFDPEGRHKRVFASGLRNCSGMTVQPSNGALWCVVNERDGLGDDLPPDFATRIVESAFYGWPWYYIGAHQDPLHKGERPDLFSQVTTPDVLIQPHSAPLGIVFYEAGRFPAQYQGDAFVALHGSWNRAKRTGYKVVRLIMKDGAPTGAYEDFLTGFVADDSTVWGRPVGVAVTRDGALLVSDDEGGAIWRITYRTP